MSILKRLGFSDTEIEAAFASNSERVSTACLRIVNMPFANVRPISSCASIRDSGVFVGTSGGKDSVVVQWLAKLAFNGTDVLSVHTPKYGHVRNAVHGHTREFLYRSPLPTLNMPVAKPELFKAWGLLTQIDGTRASEATRTDGREVTVISNGKEISRAEMSEYSANGVFGLNFVYPIYDWTDVETWATIVAENIPYSMEYEDIADELAEKANA